MAEQHILGKNSILFFKDGASWLPIGCLTDNSISESTEINDGTVTKCNSSPSPVLGRSTYEVTFEAVAVEDNTSLASYEKVRELRDASIEDNIPLQWKEETTYSDATKKTLYGEAYLSSFEKSNPADGETTFSGTLNGVGKITTTAPVTV